MNTTKLWWQSTTVWFNAISALVAVVGAVTKSIVFGPQAAEVFTGILTVGNVILRLLTTTPIQTPALLKKLWNK